LTIGYVRQVTGGPSSRRSSLAVGVDVTGYLVAQNLLDSYGSPRSYHVFLRYRGHTGRTTTHRH
jgi:hypothetical protein